MKSQVFYLHYRDKIIKIVGEPEDALRVLNILGEGELEVI